MPSGIRNISIIIIAHNYLRHFINVTLTLQL